MLQDLYAKCGNNCGRCTLYAGNLTADQNVLAAAVTAQVLADFAACRR